MDHEIHYYINFLVAKQAGFNHNDAYKIAYSAQYVDDNVIMYKVKSNNKNFVKEQSTKCNDFTYKNFITQTSNLTLPKQLLKKIYTCFHFIPEITLDKAIKLAAIRKDKCLHPLNTAPGGTLAKHVLHKALKMNCPYAIGIASHAYLDTWAHQNFIGQFDSFNAMFKFHHLNHSLNQSLNERVGHIDALHYPDLVGEKWCDKRLLPCCCNINNNERFIEALIYLLKEYSLFFKMNNQQIMKCNSKISHSHFIKYIKSALNTESKHARYMYYREIYSKMTGVKNIIHYNKCSWINILGKRSKLSKSISLDLSVAEFKKTKWYKFQQAAKKHQNYISKFIILNL